VRQQQARRWPQVARAVTVLRGVQGVLGIAGVLGAAAVLAACHGQAQTGYPRPSTRYEIVPVTWRLVHADGRDVTVSYLPPACAVGQPQASVRESREQVRLELEVMRALPCDSAATERTTTARAFVVHLAEPLGGRDLVGG